MKARLLLIAAAVLFSTGGVAVKGTALNAWQVAGLRSLIAACAVLALLPASRRGWQWRYLPVAAAYASTLILFVNATKLTTAANAIFLQGAAPLFVVLLSPLLLRERVRRSDVLLMLAVGVGMALVFTGREDASVSAPNPRLGNWIAAASALTWACTLMGLRWLGRHGDTGASIATVTLGNLLAAGFALPLGLPLTHIAARDVTIVLWLGIFQVALAYVCLTRGLAAVPVIEATVLLLIEPPLNPLLAWMVHGERPSNQAIFGGAIIFLSILAMTVWQNRAARDRASGPVHATPQ